MNIRKICLSLTLMLGAAALCGKDGDINKTTWNETDLLSGDNITVTLSGGAEYVRVGSLSPQAFIPMNVPAGFSITSVIANNSTRATISVIATDFDVDFNYFFIFIHDSVLNVGSYIETDTCALIANVEKAILTSNPKPLSEHNIGTGGSAYLQIDLLNEEFLNWGSLATTDFTLLNFPAGVSLSSVLNSSKNDAQLSITYMPGDFDAPIYDAAVIINNPAHLKYSNSALTTDTLFIRGYAESVTFNAGLSSNLDEKNLDLGVVVVELVNDQTTTTGNLDINDLALENFPAGTSIQSASSSGSRTRITINLAFNGTDFDTDDTNGQVRIKSSVLTWNKTSDLRTSPGAITITAALPSASVTGSSWLREFFLDTMSLYLTLTEEAFDPAKTLTTGHFGFLNAPGGLSIGGLADKTDTTITILLNFNGTDFDASYTNVSVTIDNDVLLQTSSGSLVSEPFTIDANIEPVISSVSIPNTSMKIGDQVWATINLSGYIPDSVYTLPVAVATIGISYTLGSLQKLSGSQYRARFTVTEGGNDYLASQSIPVSNLRLNDLPVTGVNYNGSITQGNDLLDAHRPVVSSLYIIGQEDKQIGDQVVLLISAFEGGLLPEDSTRINGVPVTHSNVAFEEIGGGSYSLIYTIQAGDPNVAPGTLEARIYLRDPAGNINNTCPAISPNTLSIDASVPVIYSMTNTTPSDTVIIGGEVILNVVADGSGYTLSSTSTVNGVRKNEGLLFSSAGTTYTIRYPVKESHQTAAAGQLKASIILEDAAGNPSLPDTVILNNNVAVLTQRPTALMTLGDEICINDTATIYLTLGGAPPWRLKMHNATDTFYISNIPKSNLSLKAVPTETMNYSVDSVWDGTGNSNIGFGNALVIVNPLPVVDIDNLLPIYAVTETRDIQLYGTPRGGNFFGPGINSVNGVFNPSKAGLTLGTPHRIYYEYTDANFCFNVDSQSVEIIQAAVEFFYPDSIPVACYLDQEYTLEARNTALTTGKFRITEGSYPDGFYQDNGDNTVTFRPSMLDWKPGQDYNTKFIIRYDYTDNDGVALQIDTSLEIEYFETAYIVTDLTSRDFCSNEITIPLTGSRPKGPGAIFHGRGVESIGNYAYEFNPGLADTGSNFIVYSYVSTYGCEQYDSALVFVHQAPDPRFEFLDSCVLSSGGKIKFRNISNTSGLIGTLNWGWNYGDLQSGEANFSTTLDGSHNYLRPGQRTVTLSATVTIDENTQCGSYQSITKYIGNTPDVSVDWNTDCFTSEPTIFNGLSVTEDGQSLYNWRITDPAGTELFMQEGHELRAISYAFGAIDNYSIELMATTDRGCTASAFDTIYMRPYIRNITDGEPYMEDFEGNAAGWFAFKSQSSPQMSWKLGNVGSESFPYDMSENGSHAWYTDLVRKDTTEQSWVISPCFDFSNMRRPMISLDRKISSDRDRDGASLQYTYDNGKAWHNVGAINDGSVNWYNSFRIQNGPGGQGEGWTGGFVFDRYEEWKQSRHELDDLTGRPRVQFRIAYGSSGESLPQIENEGFAFDNVWIGERSRVVLIEHFTNSGMAESNAANERINRLVSHNPLDVIDVQYHAEVSGYSDRMNQDNPAPASARSLFYGTRQVPYMLMDGGAGGQMVYDFGNNDLDTLDLFTRALKDPSFSIGLNVAGGTDKLDITVDLKALDTLPDAEYIVYTVVLEKLIDDPAYAGTGASVFENVVRAMVPNAAGVSLIRAWSPGETETIPMSWTISDRILSREMLTVVVFVQDAGNREIYQVASNDEDLNGDPVIHTSVADLLKSRNLSMLVYPNPASDHAYLAFDGALPGPVEIQMFSHTGRLVLNKLLPSGTELYEMDLGGLEGGVYLVRAIRDGKVIGTCKLLILR
jgi:hypothetical protein